MQGFVYKPREHPWRALAFRVHLWTGLAIGVWALLMGLSGSALVFKDEIQAGLEPRLFVVAPSAGQASLDDVAREVRRSFPDFEILNFRDLDRQDRSHVVRIARRGESGELGEQWHVHYDPHTGSILGAYSRESGVFGWLEQLHYYLLLGKRGMQVNGVLGAALLLLCGTGLIVWWPGVRTWRDGLRVRRAAGWKRKNYDLHRAVGFYSAALLAVMACTGLYFGFPGAISKALTVVGGDARKFMEAPRAQTVESDETYSIDAAVRAASLPQDVNLYRIILPASEDGVITVAGIHAGNPVFRGWAGAHVAPHGGRVLSSFDSKVEPLGTRLALMAAPIHFGEWGGAWSKALWCLLGLVPGALFVTGFLMWRNRSANGTGNRSSNVRAPSRKLMSS